MDPCSRQRSRNPSAFFQPRFQTALLTYLSSELRNPLNTVLGYCQVLLEDTIDLGRGDFVSRLHQIQKECVKLQTGINTISNPNFTCGEVHIYVR